MKRKTFFVVLSVIAVVIGVLGAQIGVQADLKALVMGLAAFLAYVFYEAKADIQRAVSQATQDGRFKDPKFWITCVSGILAGLKGVLGVDIPVEPIIAFLTIVVGILFKAEVKPA